LRKVEKCRKIKDWKCEKFKKGNSTKEQEGVERGF